jgi:hypothetical protein
MTVYSLDDFNPNKQVLCYSSNKHLPRAIFSSLEGRQQDLEGRERRVGEDRTPPPAHPGSRQHGDTQYRGHQLLSGREHLCFSAADSQGEIHRVEQNPHRPGPEPTSCVRKEGRAWKAASAAGLGFSPIFPGGTDRPSASPLTSPYSTLRKGRRKARGKDRYEPGCICAHTA